MKPDYNDRERLYSESTLERLWKAIKPPPSVVAYLNYKRQKRLKIACGALLAALAGWMVYSYIAGIPQRARDQLQAGMKYMGVGDYRAAIGRFNRALKIQPGFAEASLERGIAYRYLNEDDEAMDSFEEAIRLNPNLARAYLERGLIYRQGTNLPRAVAEITKSISLAPDVATAYVERGQTYEMMGQHQNAIDDYTQAIALLGNSSHIYRARSLARRNLGDEAGYESDRDAAARSEFPLPLPVAKDGGN